MQLNKEFRPALEFKTLNKIYLLIGFLIVTLPWYIPVMILTPPVIILILDLTILLPILIITLFIYYWIPKYYESINYKLTNEEIIWRRGVWFKNTGIVPYNRITNVDISQGPISRRLGIAALKIQTAGYSAQQTAEIKLEGIRNSEELREQIINQVRGRKPTATETYQEKTEETKVLNELIRIRKILEKKS